MYVQQPLLDCQYWDRIILYLYHFSNFIICPLFIIKHFYEDVKPQYDFLALNMSRSLQWMQ